MSPKRVTKPLDIYVGVSDVRDRAGEIFISPEDQEERCRAAIASRGLEAGEVFLEVNVSGGKVDRPQLAKARKRIEDGLSGGLVVAKLDRFGRTVVGALQAVEEIDQAGGVVVTAEGDFDTSTAVGELVLNTMLTLAQFELRRIRDHWRSAQRRAVERGVHISRHAPPGYDRAADGRLKPHPKHGKTLAEAFRMAASGRSYAEIASYLNERRLLSAGKETHWKSNRIKRLLANPVYLGAARYGEIVKADAHEPLTDRPTFLRAQREKRSSVSSTSTHLLSGLVRCASCTHAMRPQRARGKTVGSYRCATDTASGRCPHPSSVSMNRLERYVLDAYVERTLTSDSEMRKPKPQDNSGLETRIEDARQGVADVENLRSELRPVAYAQALDSALAELEAAEGELAQQGSWDEHDIALRVNSIVPMIAEYEDTETGKRTPIPFDEDGMRFVRAALARDIQAVFVRPAASRSNKLPICDRVRIVWSDEDQLDLPRRGERFKPRAYVWS